LQDVPFAFQDVSISVRELETMKNDDVLMLLLRSVNNAINDGYGWQRRDYYIIITTTQ
jgi:hypothetical protein